MSKKTKAILFDTSKLSEASLRKYEVLIFLFQSYFNLQENPKDLHSKIANHFQNDLIVNPDEVLQKFFELKREDKNDKMKTRMRIPKINKDSIENIENK